MAEAPILSCTISHRMGSLEIAVGFRLSAPWTVLFGPSGGGKSTILRTIAGFVTPDQGCILAGPLERPLVVAGPLLGPDRRVNLPPDERPVRYAPQAARLIPHRTVLANLRYGVPRGVPHAAERELMDEVLALFRLRSLAERMPYHLSGGEMQRVSVARAVVSAVTSAGPQRALLLLDEPFSGMDLALRDDLAPALREFLRRWKTPVLSVSHDVAEAYLLDAEIVRLAEGQIVEQGPVDQVLAAERERVARQLRL